jgi:hypothetical protein
MGCCTAGYRACAAGAGALSLSADATLTASESVGWRCAQLRDQEQTWRPVHVWSPEHWPSGCKLPARPCSRSSGAALLVSGCPLKVAIACVGCCTSLLYATTGVNIAVSDLPVGRS